MNDLQRNELLALIGRNASDEGVNETAIPGVYCYRATSTAQLTPSVYDPSLCVVAQGSKQAMLDKDIYHYSAGEYLIVSVDLPMIGQVLEASVDKPYLCIKVRLDLQQLSELMLHTRRSEPAPDAITRGLFTGKLDATESECLLRLARLLDTPDDIPVLAPLIIREIHYRLLRSDYSRIIAQTALKGSQMQRIASVIQTIKAQLNQPISVQALAERAGMSLSTFHLHFKAVTAMSPLQFQKHLRLLEARQLLMSGSGDAAHTAYQVGYESPSQFSREYARMFGNPPRRDISFLRDQQNPVPQ